jgi:hypothetical protein
MKTGDLFVIYQHNEHYTSYIVDDLLFHTEAEAKKFASKLDKSKWKAPMKIATLSEFMGDCIEAMQDEGFDLAWKEGEGSINFAKD